MVVIVAAVLLTEEAAAAEVDTKAAGVAEDMEVVEETEVEALEAKIWIYKDRNTGEQKGEATVTYDDPQAAQSAISWFDGKDFNGSTIKVQMAMVRAPPSGGYPGSRGGRGGGDRGRGSFGGRGGGRGGRDGRDGEQSNFQGRPGDWRCSNVDCGNSNFSWRNECNKCHTPKPAEYQQSSSSNGSYGNSQGYRGRGNSNGGYADRSFSRNDNGGGAMRRGNSNGGYADRSFSRNDNGG